MEPLNLSMFYTIYKITNLINNRIYIGRHQTRNLDDGYMGSGQVIKQAILKYGKENFKKEYLYFLDTEKEMFQKEAELLTRDFIGKEEVYNIRIESEPKETFVSLRDRSHNNRGNCRKIGNYGFLVRPKITEEYRNKVSIGLKAKWASQEFHWTGRKHTEESKRKTGEANSIKQKGSKNSQFGTCWITKENTNKKIKKEEVEMYTSSGWKKGRVINATNTNS